MNITQLTTHQPIPRLALVPPISLLCLTLLLGFGAIGCSAAPDSQPLANKPTPPPSHLPQPPTSPPKSPQPAAPINPKLTQANTHFSFRLFAELWKRQGNQNLFISPVSIATALAMTSNGAAGQTQTAMAQALQLQGLSRSELNKAQASLQQNLSSANPQVTLTIANSLWVKQGTPIKPDFLNTNQRFYNAQVSWLDFAKPEAPTVINRWVSQSTQGRIEKMVDRLSPDDVLYLMNAIYFKGKWTTPFDPKQTTDQPFYLANGQSKKLPMMQQQGRYAYTESDLFQAVSLPYGTDRRLSLYLFLPQKGKTLQDLTAALTAENWTQWMTQFSRREGSIQMPRFKLEYGTELKQSLTALGMGVAFDAQQANFSHLSAQPTFIGQVRHKTFLEINEEGTEAAGVTSVGIVTTSLPIDPPFQLVVNRPFFCVIHDQQTGALLFMGTIVDPGGSR